MEFDKSIKSLRPRAIFIYPISATNFCDASHWWNVNKLVDQPLSIHLGKNTSLVVIPESSAHGLIVHIWLVLVHPPQPGHSLAVHQLEYPRLPVHPLDVRRAAGGGLQQGQQELPQVGTPWVFRLFLVFLNIFQL